MKSPTLESMHTREQNSIRQPGYEEGKDPSKVIERESGVNTFL